MKKLTFLKELMLIRQVDQNSVIFVTIVNFQIKDLCFDRMSAIVVMICY